MRRSPPGSAGTTTGPPHRPTRPRTRASRSQLSTAGCAGAQAGASHWPLSGRPWRPATRASAATTRPGKDGSARSCTPPPRLRRCRQGWSGSIPETVSSPPATPTTRPCAKAGCCGSRPIPAPTPTSSPVRTPAPDASKAMPSASWAAPSPPCCRCACHPCSPKGPSPLGRRRPWSSPTPCRTPPTGPDSSRPAPTP